MLATKRMVSLKEVSLGDFCCDPMERKVGHVGKR